MKLNLVKRNEHWDGAVFFSYLERFHIPLDKKIKTFLRGMTMKLSIGTALSHKAALLILDEATAGLDPVAREEIPDVLLEFVEDEGNSEGNSVVGLGLFFVSSAIVTPSISEKNYNTERKGQA